MVLQYDAHYSTESTETMGLLCLYQRDNMLTSLKIDRVLPHNCKYGALLSSLPLQSLSSDDHKALLSG